MSIFDYDVINKINKDHSWIDAKHKMLMSRDIPCNQGYYYTILRKYNNDTKEYEYFVVFGENPIPNANNKKLLGDFYNRTKIKLNDVWGSLFPNGLNENIPVTVSKIEDDDDRFEIYKIDY